MKYPKSMRFYHWLMAVLIIFMLVLGLFMEDFPDSVKFQAYGLHKSIGAALLFLIVFRIINRLKSTLPASEPKIPALEAKLAKLGHLAFYILLFAMPLTGYLLSNSAGYPVNMFGIPLPTLIEKNDALREFFGESHEIIGFVIMALLAVHIAAVVKHIVKDKVNLLDRMRG